MVCVWWERDQQRSTRNSFPHSRTTFHAATQGCPWLPVPVVARDSNKVARDSNPDMNEMGRCWEDCYSVPVKHSRTAFHAAPARHDPRRRAGARRFARRVRPGFGPGG